MNEIFFCQDLKKNELNLLINLINKNLKYDLYLGQRLILNSKKKNIKADISIIYTLKNFGI